VGTTKIHHYDSNAIAEAFFSTRTMFLNRTEKHDERQCLRYAGVYFY
jgi:hypothetical protein